MDLTYQVFQILPAHAPLGGWDVQEVPQLLELALWEGDRPCISVYNIPKDPLDTLLIYLSGQELLGQHQVLGFPE